MSSPLPVSVLEQPSPASRLFGYARVSTDDQDLSLQIDAPLGTTMLPSAGGAVKIRWASRRAMRMWGGMLPIPQLPQLTLPDWSLIADTGLELEVSSRVIGTLARTWLEA